MLTNEQKLFARSSVKELQSILNIDCSWDYKEQHEESIIANISSVKFAINDKIRAWANQCNWITCLLLKTHKADNCLISFDNTITISKLDKYPEDFIRTILTREKNVIKLENFYDNIVSF
jgi:hypothetical protein